MDKGKRERLKLQEDDIVAKDLKKRNRGHRKSRTRKDREVEQNKRKKEIHGEKAKITEKKTPFLL